MFLFIFPFIFNNEHYIDPKVYYEFLQATFRSEIASTVIILFMNFILFTPILIGEHFPQIGFFISKIQFLSSKEFSSTIQLVVAIFHFLNIEILLHDLIQIEIDTEKGRF